MIHQMLEEDMEGVGKKIKIESKLFEILILGMSGIGKVNNAWLGVSIRSTCCRSGEQSSKTAMSLAEDLEEVIVRIKMDPHTSTLVRVRPSWKEMQRKLANTSKKGNKRLLDTEVMLINSKKLSDRFLHVNTGTSTRYQ